MSQRRSSQFDINMFPFLSVLCAVMGILILSLIVIVGTRAMEPGRGTKEVLPPGQDAALAEEVRQLQDRLAKQRKACRELRDSCRELSELIAAKADQAALDAEENAPRKAGNELGLPIPVQYVPDPKRRITKTPIFMEVKANEFAVPELHAKFALGELNRSASPLAKFLDRMDRANDREYLILVLHDDGVSAYERLRRHLNDRFSRWRDFGSIRVKTSRIEVGVEPFCDGWDFQSRENKE